jgi:hypothetical protein
MGIEFSLLDGGVHIQSAYLHGESNAKTMVLCSSPGIAEKRPMIITFLNNHVLEGFSDATARPGSVNPADIVRP